MVRPSQRRYTVEDYFFVEVGSPIKHEYFGGEVYAIAGGTRVHARVATNVLTTLSESLRGTPCEAFTSDMRVMTPSGLYTYPDASVVCGEVHVIGGEERATLLNPVVLMEVLSDSTREYDCGEKFEMYRSISALRDVVLIEQSKPRVEHRHRARAEEWISRVFDALDQTVSLESIGVELPLARIYERVDFPR